MNTRILLTTLGTSALVWACSSNQPAAAPSNASAVGNNTTITSATTRQDVSTAPNATVPAVCSTGDECVTVVGDPCSLCPACPGASTSQMTKAEYKRLTEDKTCAATHRDPNKSPVCAPCTR